MNAVPNRRRREFDQTENASALDSDAAFFAAFPATRVRVRSASAAEVAQVQALEKRLLDLEPHCEAIAMVRRADDGSRRRVVIESCAVNFTDMDDARIEKLFDEIVSGGWVAIEGGAS